MASQFDTFKSKLGISTGLDTDRRGTGFSSYAPNVMSAGNQQSTPGQDLIQKVSNRAQAGQQIYDQNKSQVTGRLANDLVQKSAGLKLDEYGKPDINLTNFGNLYQNQLQGIDQRGKNALATVQAQSAWQNAKQMQDIGSFGFSGYGGTANGTDMPGATANNPGAKAVSLAMKAMQNHTPYVWGGNSLSQGVDCSGLVQQAYRQLGIKLPRTTYEQAKMGHQVSVADARPGDLVFYNNYGHVGIYMGNGRIIHAANSHIGIVESNLTNSNGAPLMILRPY